VCVCLGVCVCVCVWACMCVCVHVCCVRVSVWMCECVCVFSLLRDYLILHILSSSTPFTHLFIFHFFFQKGVEKFLHILFSSTDFWEKMRILFKKKYISSIINPFLFLLATARSLSLVLCASLFRALQVMQQLEKNMFSSSPFLWTSLALRCVFTCVYICVWRICECVCVCVCVCICIHACICTYISMCTYSTWRRSHCDDLALRESKWLRESKCENFNRRLTKSPNLNTTLRKYAYVPGDIIAPSSVRMELSDKLPMGWLPFVGSFKLQVSSAEYHLFYRFLLQKRPTILRSLLIVATP